MGGTRAPAANRTTAVARYVVVGAIAFVSIGCLSLTPERRPMSPIPDPSPPAARNVYFAPIGEFPPADVEALVKHYHDKFALDIEVLPTIDVPDKALNPDRNQLIAERLIDAVGDTREVAADPTAIAIGLTSTDMYIAKLTWAYAYGLRSNGHLAVVSTGRMDDFFHARVMRRLEKMITKELGILYFGLPESDDPGSVLYRNIDGQRELDTMSEDF
jgi:predicted Zn-dependent protease